MSRCVALFHNISSALRAEKVLLPTGWPLRLIPTPRHLSSDCGVALRFGAERREEVRERLAAVGVEAEIHPLPEAPGDR
ncbi:MAG TPA: DUF3343 domain-containing protein [Holophaga sp.]|nr:DUF3343 domain-containing protein [Holophaga sp.]